jgi:hypothetical protein
MRWAQICWRFRSEMSPTDLIAGPACDPPATTSSHIWPNGARFTQPFVREVPGALFAGPDVAGATDWVSSCTQAMPEGLVLLTHHTITPIDPRARRTCPLTKLLRSNQQIRPLLERLAQFSPHVSSTLPDHGNEFRLRRRLTGR